MGTRRVFASLGRSAGCSYRLPRRPWIAGAVLAVTLGATAGLVASAEGVPASVPGPQAVRWELVDQLGGANRTVAAAGDLAVVGSGARLAVLDVADPAQPRLIGQSAPLAGVVQDIALRGTMAWVAAGGAGLYAVDIADPAAPAVVGHQPIGPRVWLGRVYLHGDLAIAFGLPGEQGTVWLVPIADPSALGGQPATPIGQASFTNAVAAMGNTLIVAAGDLGHAMPMYIKTYDIADPTEPRLLRTYPQTTEPLRLARYESLLLLIGGDGDDPNMVTMFDVGLGGSLSPVASSVLHVDFPSEIALAGDRLYLLAYYKLYAYDIRADGRVTPAGGPFEDDRLINAWYSDLVATPDRLYLATGQDHGVLVVDAAAPEQLRIAGEYHTVDFVEHVAVTDSQVVVTPILPHTAWSFRRLAQDPLAPPVELPGVYANDVDAGPTGETLWVAGGTLEVYDVADPAQPRLLGAADGGPGAEEVSVAGGLALTSRNEFDVDVIYPALDLFDVSDFNHLRHIADLGPTTGPVSGEPLAGDLVAVVGGRDDGIHLFDAADRTAVREVAALPYREIWDTVVMLFHGDRLYVAGNAGLQVADVSQPVRPRWVGRVNLPRGQGAITAGVTDMGLLDGRLIIVQENWLSAYDLPSPDSPALVATASPLWLGSGLAIRDGLVYLADTVAGVTVWHLVTPVPGELATACYLPVAIRPSR